MTVIQDILYFSFVKTWVGNCPPCIPAPIRSWIHNRLIDITTERFYYLFLYQELFSVLCRSHLFSSFLIPIFIAEGVAVVSLFVVIDWHNFMIIQTFYHLCRLFMNKQVMKCTKNYNWNEPWRYHYWDNISYSNMLFYDWLLYTILILNQK